MTHVTKAAVVRISDAQYFILRFVVGELFLCTRVRTWPQTCMAYMHTEKMMMEEEIEQKIEERGGQTDRRLLCYSSYAVLCFFCSCIVLLLYIYLIYI